MSLTRDVSSCCLLTARAGPHRDWATYLACILVRQSQRDTVI